MANSKYEYVRDFERDEILLQNTWIVVRIDGRGFHKLSNQYDFEKPSDIRALNLMNAAAVQVMTMLADVVIAYGVSDEFSFVLHKSTNLFERRASKLVSTIVSTFTAVYVHLWSQYFPETKLLLGLLPTFDGRAVCYPSLANLRDYLSWRQVDCHINNLYNTTFWTLVQQGKMSNTEAENLLKGTVAGDKNEILFSRFQINYNNEPEIFRKGSVVFREYELEEPQDLSQEMDDMRPSDEKQNAPSKTQVEKLRREKAKAKVVVSHFDIIKDDFWERRPWILSGKAGKPATGTKTT